MTGFTAADRELLSALDPTPAPEGERFSHLKITRELRRMHGQMDRLLSIAREDGVSTTLEQWPVGGLRLDVRGSDGVLEDVLRSNIDAMRLSGDIGLAEAVDDQSEKISAAERRWHAAYRHDIEVLAEAVRDYCPPMPTIRGVVGLARR